MKLRSIFQLLVLSLILSSCITLKYSLNGKKVSKQIEKEAPLNGHFTGFILHDPATNKNLIEVNPDKYFTPASNAKLITFFASLVSLGDSIPGLKYQIKNDTLYFAGTGDPTFLHPDFDNQRAYDFLLNSDLHLAYVSPDFQDDPFGPGWTWEDYEYYYQMERSGFPIYGNAIHFVYDTAQNKFNVVPEFFNDFVQLHESYDKTYRHTRNLDNNIFHFAPDTARSAYKNRVPFKWSNELNLALLKDTLAKPIYWARDFEFTAPQLLYSVSAIDLYYLMLQRSDNFIAEQLAYIATQEMGIDMSSTYFRNRVLSKELYPYRDQLIWKDGSGLSRYNLVTPSFMISLLKETLKVIPMDDFKSLLPKGGYEGTIRNWYKPEPGQPPYVFAKTGTLSSNHNLTGIIRTQSGKDLLFTFMNNNYKSSSYPVKKEMEKVLKLIYEKY
ncbi:D-alanyl-D-alanine carboxypeptidase [Reichenbachiella ulvae]|uniref:D-alanyl-D-alanine carboxypeptidase n=1 Tax=Reichenbachiella ulvae TaxID=2980104 RepID=A0ABT3CPG8_9BACT|nr:D-alanyl-D-alanine carboxypeptidase [Reichenbachiella ulvae]MCV9385600.1 D-alanyl-D-alanine carboxypeptidase [Reichenbachiella ulvae]